MWPIIKRKEDRTRYNEVPEPGLEAADLAVKLSGASKINTLMRNVSGRISGVTCRLLGNNAILRLY
jgi:hypothetical protein